MSIAVVGSGIAGLSSTYHLRKYSDDTKVSLFESAERIGGHAYPFKTRDGDMVDLGFMVCNHVTYPNLMEVRMCEERNDELRRHVYRRSDINIRLRSVCASLYCYQLHHCV